VTAGFDPSIGFAHQRSWNLIPLVFDLMEPLWPVVDRKILEFVLGHTFSPGDFTINSKGGCRLNPHFAKVLVSRLAILSAGGIVKEFSSN
jgi:CRISPR/Cas system-associated endonuclease Cas1